MEVVASLSQGRTAAAQCGLITHKSVPVIFEPPCTLLYVLVMQQHIVFMCTCCVYVYMLYPLQGGRSTDCSKLRVKIKISLSLIKHHTRKHVMDWKCRSTYSLTF